MLLLSFIFSIGDKANQVHMEGYQVSNQCMALVRDNCLVPTKDAPELGYVRESTDKQYVPDVYYKVSETFYWFSDNKLREKPILELSFKKTAFIKKYLYYFIFHWSNVYARWHNVIILVFNVITDGNYSAKLKKLICNLSLSFKTFSLT